MHLCTVLNTHARLFILAIQYNKTREKGEEEKPPIHPNHLLSTQVKSKKKPCQL
jgi:hypothetical protein